MATFKSIAPTPSPRTGELLKAYFKKKRIHKNALARALNRNRSTLVTFQKNDTIQTNVLWDICYVLKHNFFHDIAGQLPADFTTDVPEDKTAAARIAALELEVKVLQAEKEVLIRAMKG